MRLTRNLRLFLYKKEAEISKGKYKGIANFKRNIEITQNFRIDDYFYLLIKRYTFETIIILFSIRTKDMETVSDFIQV